MHSTQFSSVAGGSKCICPVGASRGSHDRPPKAFGFRSIRIGDVHSPVRCAIGKSRAVCEKERDWAVEKGIARP